MPRTTHLTEKLLDNNGSPFADEINHERAAIERGYRNRKSKADRTIENGAGATLSPAQAVLRTWHADFARDLRQFRKTSPSTTADKIAVAVARVIKPDLLAQIVLSNMLSAVMRKRSGAGVQAIARKIGSDSEAVLKGRVIGPALRNIAKATKCGCSKCVDGGDPFASCQKIKRIKGVRRLLGDRQTFRVLKIARERPDLIPEELSMIRTTSYVRLGVVLIERARWCCEIATKDEKGHEHTHYAFDIRCRLTKRGRGSRNHTDGWRKPVTLIPTRGLIDRLHGTMDRWLYRRPSYPFSLIPPPAWSDPEAGGYVVIRKGLIANGRREQYDGLKGADLTKVYDGLNAMGRVRWQVTPQIADVIEKIATGKVPGLLRGRMNKGGRWLSGVPNVPPSDDPPFPQHPLMERFGDRDAMRAYLKTDEGKEWKLSDQGRRWRYKARAMHRQIDEIGSWRELWVLQLDRMREAGLHPGFYFGHDIEFRGRAKPQELYFSHHGPDVMRGLLRFANPGQPCDDMAELLSINAANRWGGPDKWDKKTLAKKATFADEFREMIDGVVRDPTNCLEWLNADEPFQFLSACIAIEDARTGCRDGHALKTVVYQDATANGLQHFSAAGRDPIGAALVNLVDGPERINSYRTLANEARPLLIQSEHPIVRRIVESLDESLVKTPFLAMPYGVTPMGMKDQLFAGFKEKGWEDGDAAIAAPMLAKVIRTTMARVAPAAIDIMDWIRRCVALACKQTDGYPGGRPFRFKSPSGLPIIQPYRRETKNRVEVNGHSFVIRRSVHDLPVNLDKQKNAAPANVVHSWDAAVASTVAVRAEQERMSVAVIYDCFGTTVDRCREMKQVYLEEFVRLHESNPIDDLASQMAATYHDVTFPAPPPRGTFDLRHILRSTYAIS